MWKRDESVKPAAPSSPAPAAPAAPAAASPAHGQGQHGHGQSDVRQQLERDTKVNIGKSIVIKGELSGSEDLTIEGQVEGRVELRDNVLTIGPNGKIRAEIFAKAVIVLGDVTGNVTASEKVDIRDNGSVDGDITSPRVAIADGAHFRGSVDMQRAGQKASATSGKAAPQSAAAERVAAAATAEGQRVGA